MSAVGDGRALSQLLRKLADDVSRDRIAVGDLLHALGDRAIGALLFIFAFPNILPVPPGTSAVLGAPLVFLAAQLTFGMRPWLPGFISRRSMPRTDFQGMIRRVVPWLERAEKLLRPRASVLALPPFEYIVGVVCLLLATVLVLPIPLGNMLPALSISLLALGLLERDGYAIALGLIAATMSAVVVSGVIWGIIKGIIFMISGVFA
ncbi:exopolysaccharide biosynthesis protein [Massilia sp. CCM 9210]|uniref:exopolysaccharide biosynthesis protein n=1 Tax=Massilia scottii TaxID=3057166 RepID=UPI002796659E|nr:exopolysaccharide biosynthesis protein [Massilia sp. CCM 9210]MDQ1818076.1 exopolysaccharide biosynthesis protein [Massilia sp. CCM 9210]